MRKRNPARILPLGLGLLLGGPALSLGAPAGAPGDLEMHFADGRLSVVAEAVPLDIVVRAIADHAGLRLVQHAALDRPVTVTIEAAPLPESLDALLEADSYQLYRAGDAGAATMPATLWIFSPGSVHAPAATAYLEIALLEGGYAERMEAVRELKRLATREAVQSLGLVLADDDARICEAAMEALASIGTDEALAALASATGVGTPGARGRAAQAIGMAGGGSAVEYLRLALEDGDVALRSAAIEALDDVDDSRAAGLIRAALEDPDPRVRGRAVEVLEAIDDEAAFEALYGSRSR